ncbi:hypothetical protein PTSG_00254 [Salpingoeca rosetta]|uniref:Transmembrane protein n=1 Tax=Salpingoeca rosetta (strain ATCC 50818 / BSB-021) TaxID=946362 RepID=F2TVY8_SALR5|nr:uncharacterized protein PTSG_00254 [Salpingoeca rosetta]EGD72234.1 hypothetical protein PTSG_00254 [Salpingoeca rosetta]|eukprot:XP_004998805.1 hypothetical protein PTSG_00254 [Salpingoeca rosetta]
MPRRRGPMSKMQLIGLFLFVAGLIAVFFSFEDPCPNPRVAAVAEGGNTQDALGSGEAECSRSGRNFLLGSGIIMILLFCCCPAFALGDARPFYEQFPWLRRAMNRRRQKADGTYRAHAASLKEQHL